MFNVECLTVNYRTSYVSRLTNMSEHDLEKLLGGFAADTLTSEEKQALYTAALRDQQLFNALADEQALKELLSDPDVCRRLLTSLEQKRALGAAVLCHGWIGSAGRQASPSPAALRQLPSQWYWASEFIRTVSNRRRNRSQPKTRSPRPHQLQRHPHLSPRLLNLLNRSRKPGRTRDRQSKWERRTRCSTG